MLTQATKPQAVPRLRKRFCGGKPTWAHLPTGIHFVAPLGGAAGLFPQQHPPMEPVPLDCSVARLWEIFELRLNFQDAGVRAIAEPVGARAARGAAVRRTLDQRQLRVFRRLLLQSCEDWIQPVRTACRHPWCQLKIGEFGWPASSTSRV